MIYDVNSPLYQGFLKVNAKRTDEAQSKARKQQGKMTQKSGAAKPAGAASTGL